MRNRHGRRNLSAPWRGSRPSAAQNHSGRCHASIPTPRIWPRPGYGHILDGVVLVHLSLAAHTTDSDTPAWCGIWSSMWSKNFRPVSTRLSPLPSRSTSTRMSVSDVRRATTAQRSVRRRNSATSAPRIGHQRTACGTGLTIQHLPTRLGPLQQHGTCPEVVRQLDIRRTVANDPARRHVVLIGQVTAEHTRARLARGGHFPRAWSGR